MYKVLVIGCGGSGAKTVAFMMDQLRADLSRYGISEIPQCWQFLNIDVPVQEEDNTSAGIPKVSDLGGKYVACGVAGGTGYGVVDARISNSLLQDAGLRDTATWMPREPSDVHFPVDLGAGQYRAIGRLLFLNKLSTVKDAISEALGKMNAAGGQALVREVAEKLPGAGSVPLTGTGGEPIVLVISSMAGGAGASMTLDVCRLAAAMPGIDANKIAAYLYTADVFTGLTDEQTGGMQGNTLAMLGELIAAQIGGDGEVSRLDCDLYGRLGVRIPQRASLKRVIPIGRRVGGENGAIIGDGSATGVFRSIGRGLARFISGYALSPFVQYNVANNIQGVMNNVVAWGSGDPGAIAWSSFGYASLSLGRERYLEYSAQRISRRVIDHSVAGHKLEGDTQGTQMQLTTLWSQNRVQDIEGLGLPVVGQLTMGNTSSFDSAVSSWVIEALGGKQTIQTHLQGIVDNVLAQIGRIDPGTPVDQWQRWVTEHLARSSTRMKDDLRTVALRKVWNWTERVSKDLNREVGRWVSRHGLVYAERVLDELSKPSGELLSIRERLLKLNAFPVTEPWVFPSSVAGQISIMSKNSTISGDGFAHLETELRRALNTNIFQWFLGAACVPLADAVADFADNGVVPMKIAVNNAVGTLFEAMKTESSTVGVAYVETQNYLQWPTEPKDSDSYVEESIPLRFGAADNEVVLMKTSEYLERFEEHIVDSVAAAREKGSIRDPKSVSDAYRWAVSEVLTGEWARAAGDTSEEDEGMSLVEVNRTWIPKGMQEIERNVTARSAIFRLRVRPGEVLERARAFVGRKGEAFDKFATESLYDFVSAPLPDHETAARVQAIKGAIHEALLKAQPLSSVDAEIFRQVMPGEPTLQYSFSAFPFPQPMETGAVNTGSANSVYAEVVKEIENNSSINQQQTLKELQSASQNGVNARNVTRIDLFGSYPQALPVAYTGILGSVKEKYDAVSTNAESIINFWRWKRSRPLPGAIPFGDEERKAMIRGWMIAMACGGIEVPKRLPDSDRQSVRIWDPSDRQWVDFPAPQLTPPSRMLVSTEWLAVVLESSVLAYLNTKDGGLNAFSAYNILRKYSDPGSNNPTVTLSEAPFAANLISDFLVEGSLGTGAKPPKKNIDQLETFTERRDQLVAWFSEARLQIQNRYLPNAGVLDGPEMFTNYSKRDRVAKTPKIVDFAAEMRDALDFLIDVTSPLEDPRMPGVAGNDLDMEF